MLVTSVSIRFSGVLVLFSLALAASSSFSSSSESAVTKLFMLSSVTVASVALVSSVVVDSVVITASVVITVVEVGEVVVVVEGRTVVVTCVRNFHEAVGIPKKGYAIDFTQEMDLRGCTATRHFSKLPVLSTGTVDFLVVDFIEVVSTRP